MSSSAPKYAIHPESLRIFTGDDCVRVFSSALQTQETFGLYQHNAGGKLRKIDQDSKQTHQNSDWLLAHNQSKSNPHIYWKQTPVLLITVTVNYQGDLMITEAGLQIAKSVLGKIQNFQSSVVVLVAFIPWDPLQTMENIWMRMDPVSSGKEFDESIKQNCSNWVLESLEHKWRKVFDWQEKQQTFFLCFPSLVLLHQWRTVPDLLLLRTAEERRQRFIWNYMLPHIPGFQNVVAWLATDWCHLLPSYQRPNILIRLPEDSDEHNSSAGLHSESLLFFTDIPWGERHFIATLFFRPT